MYQRTVRGPVMFSGVGLHSGKRVRVTVEPSDPNSGVTFERRDLSGRGPAEVLLACPENVGRSDLSTTIGNALRGVSTVEHLMAALVGCGIDNARVTVDGPEVPILDGSVAPFAQAFSKVGTVRQGSPRFYLRVTSPIEVRQKDRWVRIEPASALSFHMTIDFEAAAIGEQSVVWKFARNQFLNLAPARTFCLADDINRMHSQGLARGGSLENAIVVDGARVLNEGGLRMNREFVKHKLLDCIGDLAMLGLPVVGRVVAYKTGHALNADLVAKIAASRDSVVIVDPTGQHSPSKLRRVGTRTALPASLRRAQAGSGVY